MSGTKNSISSLVAQFMRLQKNSLEIINGLNEVATSTKDTVEIEMLDENGLPVSASLPAYGYLRSQIKRLDSNIQALSGLGDNFSTVRNPDGTYAQIYKVQPIREPAKLTNLPIPSTFAIKDNWFFESFLNPLLFVKVNVDEQISKDADRVVVKRIIANTQTNEQKTYFDENIKGKNDIEHDEYIQELEDQGIGYYIDEDIVDLPLRVLRNVGSFGVLAFYDDEVRNKDINGNVVIETRRNYRLNTLNYSDVLSDIKNGKSLDVGDYLVTDNGSKYEITSVNRDESSVQLKRITGYQPVSIGSDVLEISSSEFSQREIQVNVGFDERQGVFFKVIDDNFNIVGSEFSIGITFFSSELTINNQGTVQDLATFYKDQVSDMGQIFLGMAKEKTIPSIYGLSPDAPVLDPDSFQVIQINKQLTDSISSKTLFEKVAVKSVLKNEMKTLDKSIEKTKSQLNKGFSSSSSISPSSQPKESSNPKAIEAKLNSLTEEKAQKQTLYNTTVEEIAVKTLDTPQILEKPKYKVRGFFDIPNAKVSDKTGNQEVIQFIKRYRYLSESGSSQPASSLKYKSADGQSKEGSYSNWIIEKSDIRQKSYDSSKGTYIWDEEDTGNAEKVNINQIDIPITKGEQVELQVMSVSEAGWPENPLKSDWSSSIIITFPEEVSTNTLEFSVLSNAEDKAVIKIKEDLASLGLLDHLSDQFTSGDALFTHRANSISSGFYDSAGNPINLFDKMQELTNEINSIKATIDKAKGILEVYITDGENEPIKVSPGDTIKLTAGFYNQIFTSPTTTDAGKIAAKVYNLQLVNAAASDLELSTLTPGGQDLLAADSISSVPDYNENLKYSKVPISITSLSSSDIVDQEGVAENTSYRQAPPFASGNSFSQFIYPRFKSVGYDLDLYLPQSNAYNGSYSYGGINVGTSLIPLNGESLIPFSPVITPSVNGGSDGSVWNGGYTGAPGDQVALGNGTLSEFCIHKDHPAINSGEGPDFLDLVKPDYSDGVLVYPAFRHSNHFYLDTSSTGYYKQLEYENNNIPFVSGGTAASRSDSMYANKLGFQQDDEYLIGRYSCGSYLYLAPKSFRDVQVEGSTSLAKKTLPFGIENSINIPLIYQFRSTDKLGNIGGFRSEGALSNVTYTKRIGIDIKVNNENTFSFDVEVTGKYKNDTLVSPNFFESRLSV